MQATYKRIIEERLVHEIFSGDYFVKDHATEGTTRILVSEFIDLILAGSASEEDLETAVHNFVPEYDSGTSYSVGNYCIYLNELYRCTTATTGDFDDNDWTTTNVMGELVSLVNAEATARQNMDSQLATGIGKQMNNLADFYSTTKSYVVGDVCVLQSGELMRCTSPTSGSFNPNKWEQVTVDELISDEASARTTAINNEAYYRSMSDIVLSEDIAEPYDTTKSYVVGDIVSYNLYIYRCTGATTGTWDASKWEQVTVDELFDALNFSADAISYDNTSSGLEAENVQDAIDETITKLSAVGSASGDIATFTDGSDLSMPKCEVAIEPVQDLHGYDSPWVGGAGKNKFDGATTLDNKWINANGEIESQYGFWTSDYIPVKQGDVVRRTATGSGRGAFYDINKENGVYSSGTELTASQDGYYRFCGDKSTILPTGQVVCTINNTDLTFAPYSNICPISGWDEVNVVDAGKNIYNDSIVWKNGYYINASGNETQSNNYKYIQTYIEVEPSTTYSIQADIIAETDLAITVPYYTEAQSFISRDIVSSVDAGQRTYKADFTTPSNCKYIRMSVPADTTNIIIYKKNTYTIDLDGTRYGGKVDLVSGVLTVDRAIVTFDGSSDETISEYSASSYRYRLWISEYRAVAESVLDTKLICSKLKTYTKNNLASDSSILYGLSPSDISSAYIIVKANGITNLADFKTWLSQNELQVVYPLATPLTIQLTPTVVKSLRGVNNVFADSGEILDAEYIRDMTTVLEETEILNKNILVLNKQAKVPNNGTYTNTYTATKDCYVLAFNQVVHEESTTHTVTATFSSTGTQIATNFVENNSWSSPNRVHATRLSVYKLKSGQTITFTNTCQFTSNALAIHFAVMIDERLATKISSITNLKSYVKSDNTLQDTINDEEISGSGLYLAIATSRTNSGASEADIECFTDGTSAIRTVHKYWEYSASYALFTVDKQATISMMYYRVANYAHCGYQIYKIG